MGKFTRERTWEMAAKALGISYEQYERMRCEGRKHCGKCKRWLLNTAFYSNASRPDRLSTWCMKCSREGTKKLAATKRAIRR